MRYPALSLFGVIYGVSLSLAGIAPTYAQLGIGVGFGSGIIGPGFGAFYGTRAGQGFAGVGAAIYPQASRRNLNVKSGEPAEARHASQAQAGMVVGNLNACPPQSGQRQCFIPTDLLRQVVVHAIPQAGSQQWVSTQPGSNGFYQLRLPPGQYLLSVSTPFSLEQEQKRQLVTIQPGATVTANLDLFGASMPVDEAEKRP